MSTPPPSSRSVKISDDERGGWSSDRPRRDGAPPRPADLSVRCRVLPTTDHMRYTPGSLVLVISASKIERDRFTDRLIEDKNSVLSRDKVRALLTGRVADDQIEEKSEELLLAAIRRRLTAGDTTVIGLDTIGAEEREPILRMATELKRPRHAIFLDTKVSGEERAEHDALRKAVDAGDLGAEGVQTAMRLGGSAITDLRIIVFRRAPKQD
ncbi:hypothetical protein NBH00_02770 [Paraconexibacter antarcticus]|uniref:Uncharacterized protein n=1 Tax=Paraconexibacter antarcticus TaxID=2949664 RepID=A0ABY5DV21_9ACTN|nr:hypothetical protein [Paraconexibacter antarcticus]UTI65143.1 hypothetical protein NBH00_02770 [Paraconexibacter antarcticus]